MHIFGLSRVAQYSQTDVNRDESLEREAGLTTRASALEQEKTLILGQLKSLETERARERIISEQALSELKLEASTTAAELQAQINKLSMELEECHIAPPSSQAELSDDVEV